MNVLKAFVNLHEFSDTILVQALRYGLCLFFQNLMFEMCDLSICCKLNKNLYASFLLI